MGIFNTRNKKEENDFKDFPVIGGLMVSKLVANEGKKPLFMYREKPSNKMDSGWRIFSGTESQEYVDNADNTGIYNPSTILKIDSSIADLLLKPRGSVFERKDCKSDWYAVEDYPLEDDYLTKHKLTENWNIEINNLFTRRKDDDGNVVYVTENKTVRIVIWNSDKSKNELYEEEKNFCKNREQDLSNTLEYFDFTDENVSRVGYMIEERDEKKSYKVIYGISIINHSIAQAAFYFDNDKDKEWAIETWKSIKK